MRFRPLFVLILLLFPLGAIAADSPRDALASLNALRLDPQAVYLISAKDRVEVHQPDVTLYFTAGKLVLFQPYEGRITGFVFSGVGHVIALPHVPAEKQQLARFLGAPILDQQFFSGYFRFTDDTAQDLLAQFQNAGLAPSTDTSILSAWQGPLERLNPNHSLRILFEKYYSTPRHFFHAGVDGAATGPFDILIDYSRAENLLLGQPRRVGDSNYYDVWSSYTLPGTKPAPIPFHPMRYHIDTTISPDFSLEGRTSVDFRAVTGTEQILFIALARALKVESVSLDNGETVPFFQNEGLTEQQLTSHGDDILCVFLPKAPAAGQPFTLNFRYRGNVITNAGNGVLFVGARESWYPHFGDASDFCFHDLTLHWPKRLRLVATGEKTEEREEGEFRVGHWTSPQPVSEAGFNLGEYAVSSITSVDRSIDVYANRQLEQAILSRLAPSPASALDPSIRTPVGESGRLSSHVAAIGITPSPADALKQLARDIDSSIHFYEQYSGPFPFRRLSVSQIPGTFGQGWPGLLYLSTISFLPHEAQQRIGLNSTGQEQFSDIVPFHEVAHQWWGNVVGWSSYRDQWLDESIAAYLSLLFADSQKNTDHALHAWLDRYRRRLITKSPGEDLAPVDVGPLTMGSRLSSSKSPEAYDVVIYCKGAWVIHMLREMLRQPNTANPDARFIALLRTLSTKYARAPLSTDQFQHEVESVMTPKMDLEGGRSMEWFFDQYVRGTGIPRYKVDFTSRRVEKDFQVRGTLYQSGVPRSFIAPVPLYISAGPGKSVFLGTVTTTGEETRFSFISPNEPHKLLIDPHQTLLCIPE